MKKEEFIKKANEKHHGKFTYEIGDIVRSHDEITIICPVHGPFKQQAYAHLKGQGCLACNGNKPITQEEFEERVKKANGDRIDLSKAVYKSKRKQVLCSMEVDGERVEFWAYPENLYRYYSKPRKTGKKRKRTEYELKKSEMKRLDFIDKAKRIHQNEDGTPKYDYSKVTEYNGGDEYVTVVCHCKDQFGEEHGPFQVIPYRHLHGTGCSKCAGNHPVDFNEFVKRARKVFGDKYVYHEDKYNGYWNDTVITCPEHGDFVTKPIYHVYLKIGCPVCSESHMENEMRMLLNEKGIANEPQKAFEWLVNKKALSLDFYLPDCNVAIECQGLQHIMPVDYFGGEEAFQGVVERDSVKNRCCQDHGVRLLYLFPESERKNRELIMDKFPYYTDTNMFFYSIELISAL